MNRQEFIREVTENCERHTPIEVADFIWNRWLRLYAESMPINPGMAWGKTRENPSA